MDTFSLPYFKSDDHIRLYLLEILNYTNKLSCYRELNEHYLILRGNLKILIFIGKWSHLRILRIF